MECTDPGMSAEHAQFDFRHVQSGAVFERVLDLQSSNKSARFLRLKGLV